MQVLHVCSEMFPLLKTGGLADVIGALPAAQIAEGIDTRVLLPAFPDIRRGVVDAQVVTRRDTFAGRITLLYGHFNGVGIYLIDAPHLYDRPGSPYHDTNQHAYPDNVLRFALLGWVGSEMASGLDPFWRPDVVHAHDWHAGLTPAYLAARGRPAKSVFTVHNLAYQGMFYSWHMNDIELPWSFYNMHGLEFNGQISFLKAGLYYADHITAVSPTYAREITEPQYAYGMEGLLRQRHHEGRLSGILNGVDDGIWSPQNDLLLPMRYDRDTLEEKAENKRQLQIAMGLKVDDKAPLFAVVSRLTSQKGLDLVLEALPGLLEQGGQLALHGFGDAAAHVCVRGQEDHLRVRAVLGLREQVGGDKIRRCAAVGDNQYFGRSGGHIDCRAVKTLADLTFGFGHIRIARPEDFIDLRNRFGAQRQRGNSLSAAHIKHLIYTTQLRGVENFIGNRRR